jgi:hypothetical protein
MENPFAMAGLSSHHAGHLFVPLCLRRLHVLERVMQAGVLLTAGIIRGR